MCIATGTKVIKGLRQPLESCYREIERDQITREGLMGMQSSADPDPETRISKDTSKNAERRAPEDPTRFGDWVRGGRCIDF